jgi:hydrogenase maturation protein HypF
MVVQHHHAHIAAVLAEHGQSGPAMGVAYDGTGWGEDGTIWGAEILLADLVGFRRVAHLRTAPLPGGDLAARTPWRAALGYLSLDPGLRASFALAFDGVPVGERRLAEQQLARRLNAPIASSMGRLFDAAAAVLGVRQRSGYEGHAAMELEALAGTRSGRVRPFPVRPDGYDGWDLDPLPLLAVLGNDRQRGVDPADLAADFHESVVAATVEVVEAACDQAGVSTVVLGGGVFQNARLVAHLQERLLELGCTVLLPRRLGANDGAISYGQAAVAAARLARQATPAPGGA